MIEGTLYEGTQPHRVWSQFRRNSGDRIGHLHIKWDVIETVDAFPSVEVGVNHVGVTVERFGEKTLLLGRTQSVLLEEIVFVHDTDFF